MTGNLTILAKQKQLFGDLLSCDDITEIAINKEGELWIESSSKWLKHENSTITYKDLYAFAVALASSKKDDINDRKPILSTVMPSGERVQVVIPPACTANTVSITIRKPNASIIPFNDYLESGFFAQVVRQKDVSQSDTKLNQYLDKKNYLNFFKNAVVNGKNIVIAGGTGSGKTTFMKSLIDFIPLDERIITIEDVPEITFKQHQNTVSLFYPSEAKQGDIITSATLLKSCLRMKPDRILLAELRGAETYDFINVLSSGHGGSLTSCHAGSVAETFERLALMTLQNEQGRGLPYEAIKRLLYQTIDIVVHIENHYGKRHITDIYFDPQKKLEITQL